MRFLLKTAFWLGLIAFFLPSGSMDDPSSHGIDMVTTLLGAQQAVGDLGGFCERSPMACEAGGQVATFVGARVADGVGFAIETVRSAMLDEASVDRVATATSEANALRPASVMTGNLGGPRAYQPPVAATDPMATAALAAATVRRAVGLDAVAEPAAPVRETVAAPLAEIARSTGLAPARVTSVTIPAAPAIPTPAPRA